MITSFRFLRPLLFSAGLVGALSSHAQAADEKKTAPVPPGDPRGSTIAQRPGQQRLTINFSGGSIADLVALLNKIDAAGFNLIGEKTDLALQLPPFSLRDVSPGAFAMGLRQLLEPRGLTVMAEGNEMFVLRRLDTLGRTEPARFEPFQLEPYLEKFSVDEIVAAIRMAWELHPQNKPDALQLKFHPATKLLFATGSADAIQVASKVVASLPRSAKFTEEKDVARRQAVADEVAQRRQLREGAGDKSKSPPAPEKK